MELLPSSRKGFGIYSCFNSERENMEALLQLLQDPENVLFPSQGKIPQFESIMVDLFPALQLSHRDVQNGKGYTACVREDHIALNAHAALNSETHTPLELRISRHRDYFCIGLVAAYILNPIDDIVQELTDHSYAMQKITPEDIGVGKFDSCSIAAVHDFQGVLDCYQKARTLFQDAHALLHKEKNIILLDGDLERVYKDKKEHPNLYVRNQSRIMYQELLDSLVRSEKSS